MSTRTLTLLLLAVVVLPACGDSWPGYPGVPTSLTTPAGKAYTFRNLGSVERYGEAWIGGWVDIAIEEAVAKMVGLGVSEANARHAIGSIGLTAIDDYAYPERASPTGWAAGTYAYGHIVVAFWTRKISRTLDDDIPEWTYRDDEPKGPRWGVVPLACPALGHELGHHFFGGGFEHRRRWVLVLAPESAVGAP